MLPSSSKSSKCVEHAERRDKVRRGGGLEKSDGEGLTPDLVWRKSRGRSQFGEDKEQQEGLREGILTAEAYEGDENHLDESGIVPIERGRVSQGRSSESQKRVASRPFPSFLLSSFFILATVPVDRKLARNLDVIPTQILAEETARKEGIRA